jgi:hypothetical protein
MERGGGALGLARHSQDGGGAAGGCTLIALALLSFESVISNALLPLQKLPLQYGEVCVAEGKHAA